MVERRLDAPQGTLELDRWPIRPRSTLRAWDAADVHLLRHLDDDPPVGSVLCLNDAFGALSLSLAAHDPVVVADTSMSHTGIRRNADANGIAPPPVFGSCAEASGPFDTALVKVPKTLGRLEQQLHELRPLLAEGARVVAAGMVRDIHTSTLELFESVVGPTTTSLARQRSRLIHPVVDPALDVASNPWPASWRHGGLVLVNLGGIFSANSIDIGARFLLEHPSERSGVVVDLGCGNGVLGIAHGRTHESADLTFVDTSHAAVESARRSWQANHGARTANFVVADRLEAVDSGSVDLVLNNPPFHDERAIGDDTAWEMFLDAHRVLRPGGELRVVANRSLGHHTRLRRLFGNCELVASNSKFVVLSARR